ncbi:MAG: radical SAM protein [Bacteroidaceae bacterium]|nr:radical SAM protein [Bacteroidaceae bacterium]
MTLHDYIATTKAALRIFSVTSPRLIWKFMYNFVWRSYRSMNAFEKRMAKDEPFFPAFLMVSVTETCNLACKGCWVSRGGRKQLTLKQLDGIISEGKKHGAYFYGLLGGEPLMYKGLLDVMEKHSDCYFQLFTNGTLITDDIALRLKRMGNVTPLISIEGLEEESDLRRQRNEVFNRTLRGVRACRKAGLIFGAACSICMSNYDDLVNRAYIERIAREGAMYLWYYIYRPVGAEPNAQNALTEEKIASLRSFIAEQRKDAPLFIIDTYWDDKGNAMCPGATGMSHHISPSGALEFCPPLQMATDFLNEDASNLAEVCHSAFLGRLRKKIAETTRGCILMDNPDKLVEMLEAEPDAVDTTSRGTVMEEYKRMQVVASHDMGAKAIPEQNVFYRFLKKRYFFGFGAYG